MAALLAVGIGLGAEKLGRRLSEKRLERKEKKDIAKHEALYGSSSAPVTTREGQDRKHEEAKRELDEVRREQVAAPRYERRRSVSGNGDVPPPRYEDVVRQDGRGA